MQMNVKAARGNFFDRPGVLSATDRTTRKNLSKFGAFLRAAIRTRLKYGEDISQPGGSPVIHKTMSRPGKVSAKTGKTGKPQSVSPLRELVFFAYDESRKSVVVGPARLQGKPGNAPAALEYGGPSVIKDGDGTRTVTIRPRPYLAPSFEQVKKELPGIWAGSIKR